MYQCMDTRRVESGLGMGKNGEGERGKRRLRLESARCWKMVDEGDATKGSASMGIDVGSKVSIRSLQQKGGKARKTQNHLDSTMNVVEMLKHGWRVSVLHSTDSMLV